MSLTQIFSPARLPQPKPPDKSSTWPPAAASRSTKPSSSCRALTSYSGKPQYGAERGGDIKHSLADISKAEAALGYKVKVDFEEGLRRTVDWYRGQ